MTLPPSASIDGRLHAEVNADAGLAMPRLKILRDLRRHRARHHARGELEHVDLEPLDPRGGREFEADEAGADHHDARLRRHDLSQRLALVEDAQIFHVGQIRIGQIEQPVARAGRQHEVAVRQRLAGCEHAPCAPRDRSTRRGPRSARWSGPGRISPAGTSGSPARPEPLMIGLGQRRPLIGQMRLVVDQADAVRKSPPGAGMPRPGSRHGRHRQ